MDHSTSIPAATLGARPADRPARLAATLLVASGVVGGVSLVFLIAMFAAFAAGAQSTGMTLGFVNDMLGWVSCLLALPAVVAIHALVRRVAPMLSLVLLALGLAAFGAIVVLQLLLVTHILTFEQQIGPVSIAYLALGVWFVLTGRLGSLGATIPHGARWGLFAAVYVGYPFWAVRTARILGREHLPEPAARPQDAT
jgi:hypothetical protein